MEITEKGLEAFVLKMVREELAKAKQPTEEETKRSM